VTCVWCRAKWLFAGSAAGGSSGARRTAEGYINIGSVAGVSPVRDTSTCTSQHFLYHSALLTNRF